MNSKLHSNSLSSSRMSDDDSDDERQICYALMAMAVHDKRRQAVEPPKPQFKEETHYVAKIKVNKINYKAIVNSGTERTIIPDKGKIVKNNPGLKRPTQWFIHDGNRVRKVSREIDLTIKPIAAPDCKEPLEETCLIFNGKKSFSGCDLILSQRAFDEFHHNLVEEIWPGSSKRYPYGRILGVPKDVRLSHEAQILTTRHAVFHGLRCSTRAFKLIRLYEDAFGDIDPDEPMRVEPMKIKTAHEFPKYMKPRFPKDPIYKDWMHKQINQMLNQRVIEPSNSDYNSVVKLVPKKDPDTYRLIFNCQNLNRITEPIDFYFPLDCKRPNLKDLIAEVRENKYKWFSNLDCSQGSYQIALAEQDRHKTAFLTPWGQFQYRRIPFGINTANDYMQWKMNTIFKNGLHSRCVIYGDDILVFGRNRDEHDKNLRWVLKQCVKYHIKLKLSKACISQREVDFCGYTFGHPIKPIKAKVDAIRANGLPKKRYDLMEMISKFYLYIIFLEHFRKDIELLKSLSRQKNFATNGLYSTTYWKIVNYLDKLAKQQPHPDHHEDEIVYL